jgi:hypothetical protein
MCLYPMRESPASAYLNPADVQAIADAFTRLQ